MKHEKLYFNIFHYDKYLQTPRKIQGSFKKLEKHNEFKNFILTSSYI